MRSKQIGVSVGTVIALTRFTGKKILRDATNIKEIRIVNGHVRGNIEKAINGEKVGKTIRA